MAAGSDGTKGAKGRGLTASGTPPKPVRTASIRVGARAADQRGTRLRALVAIGGAEEMDVTDALTAPLAYALWQLRAGDDVANWAEAERLLDRVLSSLGSTQEPETTEESPHVVIPGKRSPASRR